MKLVQINTVCGKGSTGKICVAVSELLNKYGVENYTNGVEFWMELETK